nr:hypothetical protein [uncultured Anaerostipes sp.]
MKSERRIQEMFKEIHAPDKLKEKVKRLEAKRRPIKWNQGICRAAGLAAVLTMVFTLSNGICYAATGKTWVRQSVVHFQGKNGKKLDVAVDLNNESGQEAELVQEDGKVYLMIDGRRAADITDDFADGKAVGTIQLNITDETLENDSGEKTFYKVTGDMDDYNITLKQGDKAAARADSTEE